MIDSVVFAISAITGGVTLTAMICEWDIHRTISKLSVFNLATSIALMLLVIFNVSLF